jgi:hypothetical protein
MQRLGGEVHDATLSSHVTALVASEAEAKADTAVVRACREAGVPVVREDWLRESINRTAALPFWAYVWPPVRASACELAERDGMASQPEGPAPTSPVPLLDTLFRRICGAFMAGDLKRVSDDVIVLSCARYLAACLRTLVLTSGA